MWINNINEESEEKIEAETRCVLQDYVEHIMAGGFPGIDSPNERAQRAMLDGYIQRVIEKDFLDSGFKIKSPSTLRRWMTAYAAAVSTPASYETIRDAATGGESDKPARKSTQPYRRIL